MRSHRHRRCSRPRTKRADASPTWRNSIRAKRRTCAVRRPGSLRAGVSARDASFTSSETFMSIGFIGLGTMGGPMARNLLKNGQRVKAAGASTAATPREVAAANEFVITMLPDAPDVERVALGANGIVEGIRAGAVYIDMSTIDPTTTRKVGAAIAAKGAVMIDSPV